MTPERLAEIRADRDSGGLTQLINAVDDLLTEVDRMRGVVTDYENTLPLALRGGLAAHTDDECIVCNHAVHGQTLAAQNKEPS